MEYWVYKADDGLILQTDPCHRYQNRSCCTKPSIPVFHYSIIPPPLAAGSRHSRLSLTWPKRPGFQRQNKKKAGPWRPCVKFSSFSTIFVFLFVFFFLLFPGWILLAVICMVSIGHARVQFQFDIISQSSPNVFRQ